MPSVYLHRFVCRRHCRVYTFRTLFTRQPPQTSTHRHMNQHITKQQQHNNTHSKRVYVKLFRVVICLIYYIQCTPLHTHTNTRASQHNASCRVCACVWSWMEWLEYRKSIGLAHCVREKYAQHDTTNTTSYKHTHTQTRHARRARRHKYIMYKYVEFVRINTHE